MGDVSSKISRDTRNLMGSPTSMKRSCLAPSSSGYSQTQACSASSKREGCCRAACGMRMSSKKPSVTWTPSRLQFRIFPVITVPTIGRKTTYRNRTSVCEAPSPGRMMESFSETISFSAMHNPTLRRTCHVENRESGRAHGSHNLHTLLASFRSISSRTASTNFRWNWSGAILTLSFSSASTNMSPNCLNIFF